MLRSKIWVRGLANREEQASNVALLSRPKGVGFGQGAGALGMDTGEHLGNKSGSEMR